MSKVDTRKKVIVCEDDEGIVELIQILLHDQGMNVLACGESDTIFAKLDEFQPDLAILDLWMPKVGGAEITEYIRQHPTLNQIPIIILSASKDIKKISQQIDATAYLEKPFNIDHLEQVVQELILA